MEMLAVKTDVLRPPTLDMFTHKIGILRPPTDTSGETSVGTHKLEEVIEKPCSNLLVIHHRKCIHDRMKIL
jgi:hypothetical protein